MTVWLTARELAGLPGMPSTEFRTREKLGKLNSPLRPRAGRGGGSEYDCSALPVETRKALMLEQIAQAGVVVAGTAEATPAPKPQAVALQTPTSVAALGRRPPSLQEKACGDARLILVTQVLELARLNGTTKACQLLALQLVSGECSTDLQNAARLANKRARTTAVGERTLYRWMAQYQQNGWWGLLPAPAAQEQLMAIDEDVAAVLACFHSRDPQFRSLTNAAKHVTKQFGREFDTWTALYGRSRRALEKVDNVKLIKARHSGSERAAKLPFKRRDTSVLKPLDVCLVDGHSFKAKVRHPDHGAPFAPEVTLVIDAATRMVCGWSVSLSENTIAVGDALRHAVGNVGVFAIVYSDNGPGESAKVFDCPVDGIIKRLGSEHHTGIPGHPQGHGLIERSWRTHMINVARQFATFQGGDVDSGTFRKVKAELDKEQRAVRRAQETGEVIALSPKCPSWKQFVDAVDAGIAEYNATHRHRSLPKRADGKRMTPVEAWTSMLDQDQQHRMSPAELRMTFMPSMLRKAERGEVVLFNQHYQAPELMDKRVASKQVSVRYDIHDPNFVMVYTTGGEFVCEAKWNASSVDYYPKAVIEIAREKRVNATVKRRQQQIDLALRELSPVMQAATLSLPEPGTPNVLVPIVEAFVPSLQVPSPTGAVAHAAAGRPFFETASERYEWLMAHRSEWSDADTDWVQTYVRSEDYADLSDYFNNRGLGWSEVETGNVFKSAQ
ncbi:MULTISPECIES: Mu transposase C-terminal domain-containing protein [unclassified Variovorax]|uniref:Mu transposase C-terminal domain-containing protein n=1 Tax=unclassified Variovorax TaxID=663243 RepID=UPI003F44815C